MTKHYVASVDQIRNLASYGNSGKKIAELLDCNVNTVRSMIAKNNIKTISGRKLRHSDRNRNTRPQKDPFRNINNGH